MGHLLNRKGLADAIGVSVPTVSAYVARGMPATARGRKGREWAFELRACVEWLLEQAREQTRAAVPSIDLEEARRRKTAAEAALAEYDLGERRRSLVGIEHVVELIANDYGRVCRRLRHVAHELAPLLAAITTAEEARDILEGGITRALAELAADRLEDDATREEREHTDRRGHA